MKTMRGSRKMEDKDRSETVVGKDSDMIVGTLPLAHEVIGSLKQPNWLCRHMQMAIQRAKYTLQKHTHTHLFTVFAHMGL